VAEHLVYGRSDWEQPLTHQGSVEADSPEAARAAALERFGPDWVELTVFPADAVVWVLREERS
jgi:hypothetical protein